MKILEIGSFKKSSLGQSSLEFLALVSMSAIILAVLYGFIASKQVDTAKYHNSRTATQIAENVGFQVEMAMVQGEGYSRVFSVPNGIAGNPYNATLRNGSVIISYGGNDISRSTLYTGDKISLSTEETNVFRVVNNGTVNIHEVS